MKNYTMRLDAKFIALGIIVAGLFMSINPATAITTGDLQDVKVVGHYFTTAISNDKRTVYTKDPSTGRYLVLVLSATFPQEQGKMFSTDFMLRYVHSDDSEDRSNCSALARSETPNPEKVFDLSEFFIGDFAWMKVNSGQIRFALAFYVEPDVETIDLYRHGAPEPVTYRIGTDRSYSVALFTNIDSPTLLRAKDVIQKGGYEVVETSETLVKEKTGITIHYREQVESQAREISQRVMTEFGRTPTLQKMELIAGIDIVIWLGK